MLAGAGMDGAVWVAHLPLEELVAIDSEAPALLVSPVFTERAHSKYATACAWSPDGTILASSGADRTLVLYGSFLTAAAPAKLATVALTGACEAVAFARSPRDDSTVLLAAVRNSPQLHCYTLGSTAGSSTPRAPTLAEWGLALSEVGDSHVSFTVLHMSPCPWDASIIALVTDHGAILLADVGARTMVSELCGGPAATRPRSHSIRLPAPQCARSTTPSGAWPRATLARHGCGGTLTPATACSS